MRNNILSLHIIIIIWYSGIPWGLAHWAAWLNWPLVSLVVTAVEAPSHFSNKQKFYVSWILPNTCLFVPWKPWSLLWSSMLTFSFISVCAETCQITEQKTKLWCWANRSGLAVTPHWGTHPSSQSDLPLGSFLWSFICKQFLLHHCLKTHRKLFCQAKFGRSIYILDDFMIQSKSV